MQLKLQNKDLLTIKCVLEKLHIQNMKINRGKVKFYKHILTKIEEYYQEEQEILKKVAIINDEGSFATDENGTIQLHDGESYENVNHQLNELAQEEAVFHADEYEEQYKTFFAWLTECEEDLTMNESILVDELLEQFEKQISEEEK